MAVRRDQLTEAVAGELRRLIKEAKQRGVSQEQIALAIGVHKNKVQRFYREQMPYPSLGFLDELARFFKTTLEDFLKKPGIRPPNVELPIAARWRLLQTMEASLKTFAKADRSIKGELSELVGAIAKADQDRLRLEDAPRRTPQAHARAPKVAPVKTREASKR